MKLKKQKHKKLKILSIEDDLVSSDLLSLFIRTICKDEIISVHSTEDGIIQIKKSIKKKQPFDVAIIDLSLDGDTISGYTFMKLVNELAPLIRCIIYTSNISSELFAKIARHKPQPIILYKGQELNLQKHLEKFRVAS